MNNNLTYTRCGGYEIPNLTLSETENKPLNNERGMRDSVPFHGTEKGHTNPESAICSLSTSTSSETFLSATELFLR